MHDMLVYRSMVIVVGAVMALLGMSVYYFRYMRGGVSSAPDIIEVGKFKGPRYSRQAPHCVF